MDDLIEIIIFIAIGVFTLLGRFIKGRQPEDEDTLPEQQPQKPVLELPEELQDILFGRQRRQREEESMDKDEEWVPVSEEGIPQVRQFTPPPPPIPVPALQQDEGPRMRPQDLKPLHPIRSKVSPVARGGEDEGPRISYSDFKTTRPTSAKTEQPATRPRTERRPASVLFNNLEDVRRAVILSEILAKPVSMRQEM